MKRHRATAKPGANTQRKDKVIRCGNSCGELQRSAYATRGPRRAWRRGRPGTVVEGKGEKRRDPGEIIDSRISAGGGREPPPSFGDAGTALRLKNNIVRCAREGRNRYWWYRNIY